MISYLARTAFIALLLVGFAGSAQAYTYQYDEVTLDNCDAQGCDGSTLFLSVQEIDTGVVEGGSWLVTYTINTENYSDLYAGFNQIGFKAIQDWEVGMITSYPDGSMAVDETGYGPGPWEPVFEAPINSNSLCDNTNGNSSKVCIAGFVDIRDGFDDGMGGISFDYTWTFVLTGGTLMDTDEWHLGAQYANGPYRSSGHIISAQVPEPTAAVLFGLGAILVTRRARRR
jgi:hypothetical protein